MTTDVLERIPMYDNIIGKWLVPYTAHHQSGYIEFWVNDLNLHFTEIPLVKECNIRDANGNRNILCYCAITKQHYVLEYNEHIANITTLCVYYKLTRRKIQGRYINQIEITKLYLR